MALASSNGLPEKASVGGGAVDDVGGCAEEDVGGGAEEVDDVGAGAVPEEVAVDAAVAPVDLNFLFLGDGPPGFEGPGASPFTVFPAPCAAGRGAQFAVIWSISMPIVPSG